MNHFPVEFNLAKIKRIKDKLFVSLEKMVLLIIDDFGVQEISEDVCQALFTIIDDRHCSKGTIVTSQLATEKWNDYLGEPTVADAKIARLMHPMNLIKLKGEGMRPSARKRKKGLKGQKCSIWNIHHKGHDLLVSQHRSKRSDGTGNIGPLQSGTMQPLRGTVPA